MSKKLYDMISKIMNIPSSELDDNSGPKSIEKWTSFKGYLLLSELENQFNIKFTIDEAMEIETISDIKKFLEKHGILLND